MFRGQLLELLEQKLDTEFPEYLKKVMFGKAAIYQQSS